MSQYNIKHKIGDRVYWLRKTAGGWTRTNKLCPECQKYGPYEHITHDIFIDGSRNRCLCGILYVPYYSYSARQFTVSSISIRLNKDGEPRIYYIGKDGVNHRESNTFATRAEALNTLNTSKII